MLKSSQKDFIKRHIGPSEADQQNMLNELGFDNLDDLISKTVPEKILLKEDLGIGEPNSEYEALRKLKVISKQNRIYSNFIGMGYYGTENATGGDGVGVIALGTDADYGTSIAYDFTSNPSDLFAINASTGVITLADGKTLDYESAQSHTVKVRATSTDSTAEVRPPPPPLLPPMYATRLLRKAS